MQHKEISGLFSGTIGSAGGSSISPTGRTFTSKDPTTGKTITDFDIETDNAVIQVKSGGGKGLTTQMKNTSTATSKEVIAYGPKLKPSVIKNVEEAGYKVFTTEKELIDYLGGTLP